MHRKLKNKKSFHVFTFLSLFMYKLTNSPAPYVSGCKYIEKALPDSYTQQHTFSQ